MNYSKINLNDIANGPGVRVSLFVSGCRNHCKGCFNPQTWDFNAGRPFDDVAQTIIIGQLQHYWCHGLTLLGGDPLEPENQARLIPFLQRVRRYVPNKTIWCYTGYLYEGLIDQPLLPLIDVLVDGPYIQDQHDISLVFRGSKNQRIIDVQHSLKAGKAVQSFGV